MMSITLFPRGETISVKRTHLTKMSDTVHIQIGEDDDITLHLRTGEHLDIFPMSEEKGAEHE